MNDPAGSLKLVVLPPRICGHHERDVLWHARAGDRQPGAGGWKSLGACRVLYMDSALQIGIWDSGTSINGGCWQVGTGTRVSPGKSGPFNERQNPVLYQW